MLHLELLSLLLPDQHLGLPPFAILLGWVQVFGASDDEAMESRVSSDQHVDLVSVHLIKDVLVSHQEVEAIRILHVTFAENLMFDHQILVVLVDMVIVTF